MHSRENYSSSRLQQPELRSVRHLHLFYIRDFLPHSGTSYSLRGVKVHALQRRQISYVAGAASIQLLLN
jgi:hypothetical protein